jgi:hypothetical protein
MNGFGASGPAYDVQGVFGFTVAALVAAGKAVPHCESEAASCTPGTRPPAAIP